MEEAETLADQIVVIDTGRSSPRAPHRSSRTSSAGHARGPGSRWGRPRAGRRAAGRVRQRSAPPNTDLEAGQSRRKGGTKVLIAAGRALEDGGIALDDLGIRRPSLDDVFLALTGHTTAADGHSGSEGAGGRKMSDLAVPLVPRLPP